MREKKAFLISSLLGINENGTSKNAMEATNLLLENGALKKRGGFCQIAELERDGVLQKINGIYEIGNEILVHAGKYLYRTHNSVPLAKYQAVDEKIVLDDETSAGGVIDGILYIASAGRLYAYKDGSLTPAYGGSFTYTPTVLENVRSVSEGAGSKRGEDVSLLTPRVACTLFGTKRTGERYKLYGNMDTERGFFAKFQIDISLNDNEKQCNMYGYTEAQRVVKKHISNVLGPSDPTEIFKVLSGEGSIYGFNAIEETNIFLKHPVKITKALFEAQPGAYVPRISFHYGMNKTFDTETPTYKEMADFTTNVAGMLVDQITFYGTSENARIFKAQIEGEIGYEGEVEIQFEKERVELERAYYPTKITAPDGLSLTLYKNREGSVNAGVSVSFTSGISGTILEMKEQCQGPFGGEPNIKIIYSQRDAVEREVSLATTCKTDTGREILLLSLGKNQVASAKSVNGSIYAPSGKLFALGSSGHPIKALCGFGANGILALKENSAYILSDTDEEIKLLSYQRGAFADGAGAALLIGSDPIVAGQGGIFELGRDNHLEVRCGLVSGKDFGRAVCIASKNERVFVFYENGCLTADVNVRAYETGREDSDYSYEWTSLDFKDVSFATCLKGKLYIGTKNGKILTQGTGFFDTEYKMLKRSQMTYGKDGEGRFLMTFISELGNLNGANIQISNGYALVSDVVECKELDGRLAIKIPREILLNERGESRFFKGMEIILEADTMQDAKIDEVDLDSGFIYVRGNYNAPHRILERAQGKEYQLSCDERGYFSLIREGAQSNLYYYADPEFYIVKRTPVFAKYKSVPLDFGHATLQKTVFSANLSFGKESYGALTVGFLVNEGALYKQVNLGKGLSLSDLDFSTLDFVSGAKSASISVPLRGVNALTLEIESREPTPLEIKGVQFGYCANGLLKGER